MDALGRGCELKPRECKAAKGPWETSGFLPFCTHSTPIPKTSEVGRGYNGKAKTAGSASCPSFMPPNSKQTLLLFVGVEVLMKTWEKWKSTSSLKDGSWDPERTRTASPPPQLVWNRSRTPQCAWPVVIWRSGAQCTCSFLY